MTSHFQGISSTTVFDIHLIQQEICKHLTLRDIRRCCLASRNLYQNFTPYLYHTIHITRKSTFNLFCRQESLDSLQRNHHHVSEVICYYAKIWQLLLKHQCFRLTVIKSPSLNHQNRDMNKLYIQDVIDLVRLSQRLRILEVGYFPYGGDAVELFCKVIRDHNTLRVLRIDPYRGFACPKIMLILWSGLKLDHLFIRVQIRPAHETIQAMVDNIDTLDKMIKEENITNRLKSLIIRGSNQYYTRVAIKEFLKRCTHLTHMGLPWGLDLSEIPNVQHLDLSSDILSASAVVRFINSCQTLTSFTGGYVGGPNGVISNMISRHSETLQEMDLSLSKNCSSHISLVFSSFPNLRELRIMTPYSSASKESKRVANPVLEIKSLYVNDKPWICRDLRKLTLWYTCAIETLEESYPGSNGIFPEVLYDNIGRLTELRVLWLGHVEFSEAQLGDNPAPTSEAYLSIEEKYRESKKDCVFRLSGLSKLENLQLRRTRKYFTKETIEDLKNARMYWPSLKRMLIT